MGDLLIGKGAIATSQEQGINRAGKGILRGGYGRPLQNNNKIDF